MTCCGKDKKIPVKRLKEEPTFLKGLLQTLKSFKDVVPAKLQNKTLLDYHMKTHMLYGSNIKRRPINKSLINSIVDLHDNFVKEMLQRKMKHNTPLQKI